MEFDVIIVAAGNSRRMGINKMALTLGHETTLERSLEAFLGVEGINKIILCVNNETKRLAEDLAFEHKSQKISIVDGGASREDSVYNGLKRVEAKGVLIHDGARPFVSKNLISKVIEGVKEKGSCIPAIKLSDSVRRVEGECIISTVNRDKFISVQTPQGFYAEDILFSFQALLSSGKKLEQYTDESEIYLEFFKDPYFIEGEKRNIKLTDENDIFGISAKIGSGYDIHSLVRGKKLVICGIEVSYDFGCLAHSDGDVAIHALIDALLSVVGELDIGSHFPDSDIKYSGIDSTIMLSETMNIVKRKNFKLNNVSIVIILEKPKLAEYIPIMRVKLANLLNLPYSDISISAKTGEGLGDIGQGLAIAAYATVIGS